jgi:hypothetical protein
MGIVSVAPFAAKADSLSVATNKPPVDERVLPQALVNVVLAFSEAILDCNVAPGRET